MKTRSIMIRNVPLSVIARFRKYARDKKVLQAEALKQAVDKLLVV